MGQGGSVAHMSYLPPSTPSLLDRGRTCNDVHRSCSGLSLQDQTVRWAPPCTSGLPVPCLLRVSVSRAVR